MKRFTGSNFVMALFLSLWLFSSCHKEVSNVCSTFTGGDVITALMQNNSPELLAQYETARKTSGSLFRISSGIHGPLGTNIGIGGHLGDAMGGEKNALGLMTIDGAPFNRIEFGNIVGPTLDKDAIIGKFGAIRNIKHYKLNDISKLATEASLYLPKPFAPQSDKIGIEETSNSIKLDWKGEQEGKFKIILLVRGTPKDPKAFTLNPLIKVYGAVDNGEFHIPKTDFQGYSGGWAEIYLIRWNSGLTPDMRDKNRQNIYLTFTKWSHDWFIK